MLRKRPVKEREAPMNELFIQGEVVSWHVLMVSETREVEVPRDRAQKEERQPDGGIRYTHQAVSDYLSLELELELREPVRGYDCLQFSITEWDAEEYGGIAGQLSYRKEHGLRGDLHMSGSFPRDLYSMLLAGKNVAMGIATRNGFYRRYAQVTALAFSDIEHPQWVDKEWGLI